MYQKFIYSHAVVDYTVGRFPVRAASQFGVFTLLASRLFSAFGIWLTQRNCILLAQHGSDTTGQPLEEIDMHELIWAVRIGRGPKQPRDEELRLRELLSKHSHKRDGA